MKLGERITKTLAVAGLTPRHLGGATRVHYVTIYRIMDPEHEGAVTASTEYVLTQALDRIDKLVDSDNLPFAEKLSRQEKTDRLTSLLADKD